MLTDPIKTVDKLYSPEPFTTNDTDHVVLFEKYQVEHGSD